MAGLKARAGTFGYAALGEWLLDPGVTYLNHGTVGVTPAQTETYTLTATDGAGQTATQTVTVTVDPNQGAQIVSFTATPATINAGASSSLAWNVQNAPEGIDIIEAGNVITSSNMATGTFQVTPAATTTYQLVAKNMAAGNDTAMVTVTVAAPNQPVVTSFTATPSVIASGAPTTRRNTGITFAMMSVPLTAPVPSKATIIVSAPRSP